MNFPFFIAHKVAFSGEKTFSRLIVRIAIAAVALSVAVMIITTALVNGFKNQISSKIFGFWGHIHIQDARASRTLDEVPMSINQPFYPSIDTLKHIRYTESKTFLGYEIGGEKETVTQGGVRHIQVFATKPGIIKAQDAIEGIILKGVGKDFDWSFMKDYIMSGRTIQLQDSAASQEIIISQQTADRLKVQVGKQFIINFVQNGEQIRRRFEVVGIYKTGLDEYDKKIAMVDIRQIQQLLNWKPDQVSGFEVMVDDLEDLTVVNDFIYNEVLPTNLYSSTVRDKFPSIFEWLELQNINEVVIITLMVIVAIIDMITALLILILERTNMIGTLKALGANNWNIRKIFLYHAAYIVVFGLLIGNFAGLLLCFLQDKFKFIRLSEADYYLSYAPIEVDYWAVLGINLGTLLVTILFLIIPTYLITRISPIKAIRFQ